MGKAPTKEEVVQTVDITISPECEDGSAQLKLVQQFLDKAQLICNECKEHRLLIKEVILGPEGIDVLVDTLCQDCRDLILAEELAGPDW